MTTRTACTGQGRRTQYRTGAAPLTLLTRSSPSGAPPMTWRPTPTRCGGSGGSRTLLRLDAAACDALVAESRPADAAGVAFRLGVFHVSRGDEPQGIGWLSRSRHLLEGVRECRVHGLLLAVTGVDANLMAGQAAAAMDAARQIGDFCRRLNEPELVALGLNGEGRALIRSGGRRRVSAAG